MLALAFCGCTERSAVCNVAICADSPPFAYVLDGELVGVDLELGKAIAEKLGQRARIRGTDFDSLLETVASGRADIAISNISITEERKRIVDFSIPYSHSSIVVVYQKTCPYTKLSDLSGKRVGVQLGTTSESYAVEKLGLRPVLARSMQEAAQLMKSARCDYVILDEGVARNLVGQDNSLGCSDPLQMELFGVAVRKGRDDLLEAANTVIRKLLDDGTIDRWTREFNEAYVKSEEN